ncbi:type I glyceraldehyde-3-phosphate dehydrogenase [Candidatus Curtissbacteria bacterium RIFCSPLOWO2_01_FULL_42_26]|uniref:Glyceraldehyde-3-phosphate dehydrogenase n=1 Tax=Candidatus Curtissbacteria bacterium RIFCSPLOWO2_01_FULL_42_26 TaxID=1797729 RepID=A0A1F5HXJ2_9BACT|nr:MAG: type I glyceraldehyde-3-phosphate dehydrogenase [Candidatus Curtissbacteria bacterium RIFCSPLOWO2_01_FULL_42_26]
MIKVAINGFGRIGRQAFKVWFDKYQEEMSIVAVNDLTDAVVLAHLLKYDSVYGKWDREVVGKKLIDDIKQARDSQAVGNITVDRVDVATYATKDPEKLPWKSLRVDVVIESTGRFTASNAAAGHIKAGAKKVVISAPGKETPTFLIGVNEDKYKGEDIINNASCTTNCIAPVAKVMHEKFGVAKALMTTIHAVTAEQNLVDGPPPGGKANDLRRARAAYINIIPTTSGAAISTTEAIPELKGKFDGMAFRVPVSIGSISDFTFLLGKRASVEEVNNVLTEAAKKMPQILAVSDEPLVSTDIIGRSESAIVDLPLTQVVDGDLVKVFAWYDNEYGYSNRLIEQVITIGRSAS